MTLGSPFSGDVRGNNVWRFYELVAGHPVDRPPVPRICDKPPVPTLAFWSRRDGIIAPACARGERAIYFAFEESERGLGIGGMRERALLLGAELVIESRPDRGTTVRLTIPS